jgi:hypothetical protein
MESDAEPSDAIEVDIHHEPVLLLRGRWRRSLELYVHAAAHVGNDLALGPGSDIAVPEPRKTAHDPRCNTACWSMDRPSSETSASASFEYAPRFGFGRDAREQSPQPSRTRPQPQARMSGLEGPVAVRLVNHLDAPMCQARVVERRC